MKKYNSIIKNIKKHYNINFEELEFREIYESENRNKFKSYNINQSGIIQSRINKFIQIEIIKQLCKKSEFIFGSKRIEIYENINSKKAKLIAKDIISVKQINFNQIINQLLAEFSLTDIKNKKEIDIDQLDYFVKGNIENYKNPKYNLASESDYFHVDPMKISLNPLIIFSRNEIVFDINLKTQIEKIIKKIKNKYENFIRNEIEFGVSHKRYIEFLQDLFPEFIKIKKL